MIVASEDQRERKSRDQHAQNIDGYDRRVRKPEGAKEQSHQRADSQNAVVDQTIENEISAVCGAQNCEKGAFLYFAAHMPVIRS